MTYWDENCNGGQMSFAFCEEYRGKSLILLISFAKVVVFKIFILIVSQIQKYAYLSFNL